jgi:hypothetical protein
LCGRQSPIIALLALKNELRGFMLTLANRLQSVKGFGVETTFSEAVDQVEQLLPTPEAEEITRLEDNAAQRIETFSALPPAYIVSQSYLKLMGTIIEALKKRTLPGQGRPGSRADHMKAARAEGLLDDDEISAIDRLRDMRNLAAHSTDPSISLTDALRYQNMVEVLIDAIKLRSAGK